MIVLFMTNETTGSALKQVVQEEQSVISRPYYKRGRNEWMSQNAVIRSSGGNSVLTAFVKKAANLQFFV